MLSKMQIQTRKKNEFIDVTSKVRQVVRESGVKEGIVVVYVPHTTAAITINENADPDVQKDMVDGFNDVFPNKESYQHMEGNSDAHLKSSVVGVSETILLEDGEMILGVWQGVYFAEFDGPRNRTFYIKVMGT